MVHLLISLQVLQFPWGLTRPEYLVVYMLMILIIMTIILEDVNYGLLRMPVWLLLFMDKCLSQFQGFGLSLRKLLSELSWLQVLLIHGVISVFLVLYNFFLHNLSEMCSFLFPEASKLLPRLCPQPQVCLPFSFQHVSYSYCSPERFECLCLMLFPTSL